MSCYPPQQAKEAASKSAYHIAPLPRSSTGFVGLKNLGCICYMNASMQNLFMVPPFRQGVLDFECDEPDKKESLMYQLQLVFANLQETEKMAYNPKGFCHALKVTGMLHCVDRARFIELSLWRHGVDRTGRASPRTSSCRRTRPSS